MKTLHYNADEIFQMAQQIERNGAIFYTKAAELTDREDVKKLLFDLARWELEHEKTFAEIQKDFARLDGNAVESPDRDDVAEAYLRAIADGFVFDTRANPQEMLVGDENELEILEMAMEAEKNSVVFYVGMQYEMAEESGRERLDRIIKEEISHINAISKLMGALENEMENEL